MTLQQRRIATSSGWKMVRGIVVPPGNGGGNPDPGSPWQPNPDPGVPGGTAPGYGNLPTTMAEAENIANSLWGPLTHSQNNDNGLNSPIILHKRRADGFWANKANQILTATESYFPLGGVNELRPNKHNVHWSFTDCITIGDAMAVKARVDSGIDAHHDILQPLDGSGDHHFNRVLFGYVNDQPGSTPVGITCHINLDAWQGYMLIENSIAIGRGGYFRWRVQSGATLHIVNSIIPPNSTTLPAYSSSSTRKRGRLIIQNCTLLDGTPIPNVDITYND